MSFFRPEAVASLWRWREVIAAAGAILLGVWWITGPGNLLGYLGVLLIAAGCAVGWVGLQKIRFRSAGRGPGWVQVNEGAVTYYGPLVGGSVALADLDRLVLDGSQFPPHWRLDPSQQPPLMIPVNAEGADDLFDAFALLPGLKTDRMLAELAARPKGPVVIWERPARIPAQNRLH